MTKVVLSVKPGNGVGYDEVKAALLSLEEFRHKGTFNITDGKDIRGRCHNGDVGVRGQ